MRIAIIGSGISGNAAAWALTQPMGQAPFNDVVVYEKRPRAGGHSHTIDIDYDGKAISVDVGFIVYNTLNYPNLVSLFKHLDVQTNESNMSFGVSILEGRLEWSGRTLATIFAQKRNLVRPSFIRMVRDILRFNKLAQADIAANLVGDRSLGDYLYDNGLGRSFIDNYLTPMGAAIWSTPSADILNFPASTFLQFFNNHRLIHPRSQRPKWRTVAGGSRSYVSKIIAPFEQNMRYDCDVVKVEHRANMIHVTDDTGHQDVFDHVIMASHSDQALAMRQEDTSQRERAILSAITYRPNTVYLHRDPALMPKNRKVWSSWNYIETPADAKQTKNVCVSYNMNMLQNIDPKHPLFVSLNPATPPRQDLTFATQSFSHPQFTQAALNAQQQLPAIQGHNNLWYCGAWCGFGFHEDGLKAGFGVAEGLGARIPWRKYDKAVTPRLEAAE